jgi:hypothetical protein
MVFSFLLNALLGNCCHERLIKKTESLTIPSRKEYLTRERGVEGHIRNTHGRGKNVAQHGPSGEQ